MHGRGALDGTGGRRRSREDATREDATREDATREDARGRQRTPEDSGGRGKA